MSRPPDLPIRGAASDPAYASDTPNAGVPRQKRLACLICRRRKLKCDGSRPSCSTCTRLGHQCAYDEVRKKSGPKRGYVKALEERLKHVEVMLKTKDSAPSVRATAATREHAVPDASLGLPSDRDSWHFNADSPPPPSSRPPRPPPGSTLPNMAGLDNNATWEIVQLGLEEPLPEKTIIDDLNRIYFECIHPSLPMIHRARFYAAMNLAVNQRPPVCLRYAMWMSACSVSERYNDLKDLFYQRARKYLEVDYMKGFGEHMISVAHCQTHVILASYEFKMMYFPRAWMSTGQATRLAHMIGLHRLDGATLEVKQCIPDPRDWTEKEERRRTFWMAFCEDRYASIGTGWPMSVDERDISTFLPASEEAFEMSRPEDCIPLSDAMCPTGIGQLTPFAGVVLMACLFGRNLTHLHRPDADDKDHDLNGEFWKRHRNLDNILLNTQLGLPPRLKLPNGIAIPNVVYTNMCIYTSTICLHQAAIFKAEKNGLESAVTPESKFRCINSAKEIAKIMRMASHMDLSMMNPFISFSLYVAARVFVQLLKTKPKESQVVDALRFLLTAMSALKRRNPLTESFLVQLDVDLEALGNRIPELKSAFPMSTDSPPAAKVSNRPGTICEDGAIDGILSYQREFSKPNEPAPPPNEDTPVDDNSSRGRILSESSPVAPGANSTSNTGSVDIDSSAASSTTTNNQQWSFADQRQPPMFQPHAYGKLPSGGTVLSVSAAHPNNNNNNSSRGYADDGQDMSVSPAGDGISNRPTPNSSTASEGHQHIRAPKNGNITSAGSSFDASPVSPPDVMAAPRRQPAGGFYSLAAGIPHSASAGVPTSFSAGPPSVTTAAAISMAGGDGGGGGGGGGGVEMSGLPTANDYIISDGWHMDGQAVSEGVLRNMIQMGPVETMDLGGWGTSQ